MKFSINKMFTCLFFISCLFIIPTLYSMVAEIGEIVEKAGIESFEGGAEAVARLQEEVASKFGSVSGDLLEGTPRVRELIQSEAEGLVNELKSELQQGVKPDNIDLGNIVSKARGEFDISIKQNFAEGISPQEKLVLEQFPGVEKMVEGVPEIPNEVSNAGVINVKIDITSPEKTAAELAHDNVIASQKNLQNLYKTGGSPDEVEAAQARLKVAREGYETQSKTTLEDADTKLENARRAELNAKSTLDEAKSPGAANKAEAELAKAKSKVSEAETASRRSIQDKAFQDFRQAEEARNTARDALDNAKKVSKDTSGYEEKVNEAQKTYDEATKKYYEARDNLLEKGGWDQYFLTKGGRNILDAFADKWENLTADFKTKLWEGLKAAPGKSWEGLKTGGKAVWEHSWTQGFIQGFVFTFPNMILEAIEAYFKNKALLDTLRETQSFGNILMKLPFGFINEEDPANSLFIYVGIPNKDQELTKEFLATAKYYVSVSDYGEVAQNPIAGSSTPAYIMLDLGTGYKFVGDGVAYDEEKPTIPLVGDDKGALVHVLNELGGRAKKGPEGKTYQYYQIDRPTGYAGDATIANLFDSPTTSKDSYPPLLQATLITLQNGTKFGNFLVQGIRGLGTNDKNDKAMWNLITTGATGGSQSNPLAPADAPYVGRGLYIYQTKDTPFIKNIRSAISPDDLSANIAAQDLVDYVIILDKHGEIVPLQTPQPQPPSNYASYALNLDAAYMVSLIDPSFARYSKDGKVSYMQSNPQDLVTSKMDGLKDSENQQIWPQVLAMQQFVEHQAQFGPFSYGQVKLTISKDLIDKKIYIYKVPGYLGKGIDDYVIAISLDENKKQQISQLPTAVQFFISLVTNKIYDSSFKPVKPTLKYFIVQQPGSTEQQVTTDISQFPSGTQTICSGVAPLHTLFVAGPFNPTKCTDASKKVWTLPNENNWAMTQYSFAQAQGKKQNIETYLEQYNQDLLNAINHAQSLWQATIDQKDPDAVARQMGPFDFTSGIINIQLTAVSEAAIKNQNFVYVSDFYPDQYLVLAQDAQGADVGKAFDLGNPQKYLVSLSNGHVYSALAQDDKGVGERVGSVTLDLQTILNQAQSNSNKYLDDLLVKIKHSEAIYNAKIIRNLYGPDLSFAQFKFYLAKPDYFAEQYIYGDVTQLAAPLDDQGNEIASVVNQINNYFIAIERVASPDSCAEGCPPAMDESGNQMTKDGKPLYWHYSFNTKLRPDTYAVASLISGATYDRENAYLGTYDQFVIKKSGITDILGFTTRMLADIEKQSGKPVRDVIKNKITQLTKDMVDRINAEKKELADAKAQQEKTFAELPETIKSALDATDKNGYPVIPYIDNPNLLPRYLKYYNGKYYAVTPGYVRKPKDAQGNEIKMSEYAPGPDRTYIDYNLSSILGQSKDTYMGMIYDSDGKARLLLGPDKKWEQTTQYDKQLKKDVTTYKKTIVGPGWALANARAYAGVNVGSDGKETHVIGVDAPTIPMGDATSPTRYLKPTGFAQLKDPTNNNQYDFYYHTQIDSYFVKVQTPKNAYYINLSSGYAYNLDGTARWFEKPTYKSTAGDILFIGTDEFGILKLALYTAKDKAFSYYTMVGNFAAQYTKDPYNARGIYCIMVSDQDPDRKIQLFQAQQDATTRAPLTYYLVWDVSGEGQQDSLGQFMLQEAEFYSLLLYAQTRSKGQPVEQGTFVAADNYIDPTADVKKPKTVGIVFSTAHKITKVIYQDQLCVLQGNVITVKNQDGSTRTVTVTQNKKSLQPAHASSIPGLTAEWISFEDGNKIYDYLYDVYILNPQQEVMTTDQTAQHLNLYNLKHGNPNLLGRAGGGFGLNVSGFVPPTELKKEKASETGPKKPLSGSALVSYLQANQDVSIDQVVFPPSVSPDVKNQVGSNLQYIKLDDSGSLFINNLVSGPTKRYVYVYGQGQDIGQVWAAPGLFQWSVDLANGILYDQDGFPSGLSLMPMQLYALLDMLQVNVAYDANGNAQLVYRTMSPASSQNNLSQAYPEAYPSTPTATPKPMSIRQRRTQARRMR